MRYELHCGPDGQEKAEFVRLTLEEAAADYVDVLRRPGGEPRTSRLTWLPRCSSRPFAPPFLKAGQLWIGQAANILLYLGHKHGLAPAREAGRLWVHELQLTILQLTIADFAGDMHDPHPALGVSLPTGNAGYRNRVFREQRAPQYFRHFEGILKASGGPYLTGRKLTYADLSLFQMVDGLSYAYPRLITWLNRKYDRVFDLHDRIATRPRIAAYLARERRMPFSNAGMFRTRRERGDNATG